VHGAIPHDVNEAARSLPSQAHTQPRLCRFTWAHQSSCSTRWLKPALELLAPGEVIARMAAYGCQLTVRSARIDQQAQRHGHMEYEGMNEHEAAAARVLAWQAGDDGTK
jgi:hypothetical protein